MNAIRPAPLHPERPEYDPTYTLDRQIASALRTLRVAGAFPVGQPRPTVRQLAVDLGVHHNT